MTSLLALLGALIAKPVPQPPVHFQLTVTPTATGYHLECAAGCTWQSLSFTSGLFSTVVVDNGGVHVGIGVEPQEGATFAFEFHEKDHGWELVRLTGSHWEKISWGSTEGPVRTANVDERRVWNPLES
jgi:hypothetical protein